MLAQAPLEQRDRLVAALQAVQQACFEQDGRDLPLLVRLLLQQRQRFLAAIILLQQHGLAEGKLWVVRVLDQQLVEALQQAGAGVRVGFRGRQCEEVEVRVALALQNLLHELERFFVTPRSGQLHGSGALGVETVGGVARPDHRGIQRRVVCAEVFGDAESAFGDAGVLRRMRLLYVIAQGDVEAVALPGKLCDQQRIEGLATERAVLCRVAGGALLGSVLDRRAAFGGLLREGLAAADEQQGGKCGESFHRGNVRLVCGRGMMTQAAGQAHGPREAHRPVR